MDAFTSNNAAYATANTRADGKRVLIVDAEQASVKLLREALIAEGYETQGRLVL